jgi:HK97 family phage portal protein
MFLGIQKTIVYSDIIHLRRHFKDEFYGAGNNSVLKNTLQTLLTLKDGMVNYVTNCVNLRGLIKLNSSQMRPEDKQAALDTFNNNINKKTGYGVVDKSMDFTQLDSELKTVDDKQLNYVRQDVYRYYGINKKIVDGEFSESDWTSFYESVIEPLIIQYQQEFTEKIFTRREKQIGNEIVLETNRLEYCTLHDKVQMAQVLQQSGVMTVNELREVFGFSGVENGDTLITKADYTTTDITQDTDTNTEGENTNE